MLLFTCACGAKLKLRDEYAGRRAKCPRCGRVQRVHAQSSGDLPLPGSASTEYIEMRSETPASPPSSGIEVDEDYIETVEAKLPVQSRAESTPIDADDEELEIHTVDDLEESTPSPRPASRRRASEPEAELPDDDDDDALFAPTQELDEDDVPLGVKPKSKKKDEEDSFFDAAVDEMGLEDDGDKPRSHDEETVEINEFRTAARADDEDDDETPKARKKRPADDDDEYALPRKKKKRRRDEDEDEDAEAPVLAREDKPKTKVSGKAIIALVLGIFGVCFAPLAIPLGVFALRDMNARPGELRGRGMAWAGIILGGLTLLSMIAGGVFYFWVASTLIK